MTGSIPMQYHHQRQRGFTLIEVLVAVVVLSIGLLGIAKMAMYSSRSNDSAYLRSQATELAYEILDNMRANRNSAIAHAYDNVAVAGAAATSPGFTCAGTAAVACNTPNSLAAYDVYAWQSRLQSSLPNGAGSVVTVTNAANTATTATIIVQWNDAVAQSTFQAVAANAAVAPLSMTLETVL